jgi:hypothetical protein
MDALLENAQRIFDVARSAGNGRDNGENQDFALLIRSDGALHFVMESPFSIEGSAAYAGAQSAYRITRSRDGVRVQGRSADRDCVLEECVLEERRPYRELLRDQTLYRITSPLPISPPPIASAATA